MKTVWKVIKKFFSIMFDPISNIFEIDLGAKETTILTWHSISIFILSLILTVGIICLYIFVIKK